MIAKICRSLPAQALYKIEYLFLYSCQFLKILTFLYPINTQ